MSSANLLFLSLLVLGPVVSVSSSNWIICWSGVELSFLGLIPLLFSGNKYVSLTKESAMKYFCIQALGSAILFYSGLMVFSNVMSNFSIFLFIFSIFIKLGIFPMHFWVPSVASGLDWAPLFFVLTVQKIAPFAFLTSTVSSFSEFNLILMACLGGLTSLVGSLMGNNQTDLRAMLGCSSIAHSGWLLLGCLSNYFWGYFLVYCLSLTFVFMFLMYSSSQMETGLGVLSLSGLPPFLMFLGKWGILKSSLEVGFPVWVISFFLMGAVISLGFYLKFFYSFALKSGGSLWYQSGKNLSVLFLIVNTLGLLFFLIV